MTPTLDHYQIACVATSVYPRPTGNVPVYPLLGFVGEVGELLQAEGHLHGTAHHKVTPEEVDSFKKEAGDVLWYVASILTDLNAKFTDLFKTGTFEEAQALADRLVFSGGKAAIVLWLPKIAGAMSEQMKKALRDDSGILSDERRYKILLQLEDAVLAICALLSHRGMSLQEIAEMNISKLAARKAKGTIQGSGDAR